MKVIIFNDKQNFDGCLKLINKDFKENEKRFWNIDKYLPFLLEKVKELDKNRFGNDLDIVKTYFYTGRYNAKLIQAIKWSCKNKIAEIQQLIDKEELLLEEINKNNLDKKIKQKIINHVGFVMKIYNNQKKFYTDQIKKSIRNRKGQEELFKKIKESPFIELKTTLLKQREGEVHQKGVDVKMAIDLVHLASTGAYDVALILGGDTDFIESIKLVQKNFSKIVIVVAYHTPGDPLSSNVSDLKSIADHFINLKDFSKKDIISISDKLKRKLN